MSINKLKEITCRMICKIKDENKKEKLYKRLRKIGT
jgi:hypothetical protein